MSDAPASEPNFRPFRLVLWVFYFVFTVTVALLVTYSVFKSTMELSPGRPAPQRELSVSECSVAASALIDSLETSRQQFASEPDPGEKFVEARVGWLKLKRQLEADCRIDDSDRASLKGAFDALESLVNAYTTHAVAFGSEVTPEMKATRRALAAVRGQ